MASEAILVWVAVAAYAVASVAFAAGFTYRLPAATPAGLFFTIAGSFSQFTAIAMRWVRLGHGPYLGFFEVGSLLALMGVAAYLGLVAARSVPPASGVVVVPVSLVVLGASVLASAEAQEAGGALVSAWLVVHVVFANLAAAAGFGACAVAAKTLMPSRARTGSGPDEGDVAHSANTAVEADALQTRLAASAFLFQGAMIASGAVWANRAWGAYWTWDPIEVWSLVAWGAYAVYLHLTLTLGWRGRRAAWVAVAALVVTLFSLLGVPVVYDSIHAAYLAR